MTEKSNEGSSPFTYYARLGRVRAFVSENLSEPISLARAADVAHLERKYFSTFFKARVGLPFHEWLRGVRVDAAKRMLRERNFQITEVAGLVGYTNLGTFERAFKTETGLTPRQFKKKVGSRLLRSDAR